MPKIRPIVSAICLAGAGLTVSAGTSAAAVPAAAPATHLGPVRSVDAATVLAARSAPAASARAGYLPSQFECIAGGARTANVNLDCDDPAAPNNEPDINVDPTDPLHMVASSNDYDSNGDEYYTTFDGGRTWRTGDMSLESSKRIGSDPVTVFDRRHRTVIHSSINFLVTDKGETTDGDMVVSLSTDGGRHWGRPVVVADGQGADSAATQVFNDKEWMVTDNNPTSPYFGRTYLTWSRFVSHNGAYSRSPIVQAHSDDGGRTWTRPVTISGQAPFCDLQVSGPAGSCDEDQFSVPTVGPDGAVYVAFQNAQNRRIQEAGETGENQYLVVRSDNGGATWSRPVLAAKLEDGSRDYPQNVSGRQTLSGMQARVNSAGSIVAHPRTGQLALVFSDNRAGLHDVRRPVTDTNVYMVTSMDGMHWSRPAAVDASRGDQWFPWVDANPTTRGFGVLYHSQVARGSYVTRLAEGRTSFSRRTVSTRVSDTLHSAVFQAGKAGCEECTTFFGDYIRVAYGSDGSANSVWTDMRRRTKDGRTENIFFARTS